MNAERTSHISCAIDAVASAGLQSQACNEFGSECSQDERGAPKFVAHSFIAA
jgi:hypothetical protein